LVKKESVDKSITEIKKVLEERKYVIGAERGLKNLKLGNVEKVYLASNCKEDVKKEAEYLAKLSNASVVVLNQPNDELSLICKKPFSISMLSVIKK
jgi:large subunit ribosomal protein L30e